MHDTLPLLRPGSFPALTRRPPGVLQLNLGYRCNQQCLHCHVAASPHRTERMSDDTLELALRFAARKRIRVLDLTGGAPEMHPGFRTLVGAARAQGMHVMDRCNLTILLEPDQQGLAEFLAENQVEIVASLPCYLAENVDRQRGSGVFTTSIEALRLLNSLGYGKPDTKRVLNLVYNPQGPNLPPPQCALESDYRQRLGDDYGIVFNRLFTLANMPIARFGSTLVSKGGFHAYIDLLRNAHQDSNLESVMCRDLISVDWQGRVYDCDFNQMLSLPMADHPTAPRLRELLDVDIANWPIAVGDHCYGCTAGQGSSCGGALL
ncbi:MAG: arsenosugar biosynthesis radical SAM protein ArsS [Gammaproteobacteria bacterium]|nr:arsenosugar biosynthesis radical SAM protein ArsS [Gammaproteobacteria bacterium]MCP5136196.1 arsenosugar biosynthesis radical SAM protein ArsS [Gammaproteobacteria bacterium]